MLCSSAKIPAGLNVKTAVKTGFSVPRVSAGLCLLVAGSVLAENTRRTGSTPPGILAPCPHVTIEQERVQIVKSVRPLPVASKEPLLLRGGHSVESGPGRLRSSRELTRKEPHSDGSPRTKQFVVSSHLRPTEAASTSDPTCVSPSWPPRKPVRRPSGTR